MNNQTIQKQGLIYGTDKKKIFKNYIIVICVSRPKSAFFSSLSFLAEAQPRLETGECEYVKLPFSLRVPKKYYKLLQCAA
jgi:hypothetical protein